MPKVAMASLYLPTITERGADWPGKNAGVMVVLVIAFLIAVTLITLFVRKKLIARRLRQEESRRQLNA